MNSMIEEKIFVKYTADTERLKKYGFRNEEGKYLYSYELMDDHLRIDIEYTDRFSGRIIDLDTGEEYTNFRREDAGTFASYVGSIYEGILMDIREQCCSRRYYRSDQAMRICTCIKEMYGDEPEYLWEKVPSFAAYRRKDNNKWYALTGDVARNKVDRSLNKEIAEVIDLHADKKRIPELLKRDGIYEAYHKNKKSWYTLIFDDVLSDEEIIELLKESYESV